MSWRFVLAKATLTALLTAGLAGCGAPGPVQPPGPISIVRTGPDTTATPGTTVSARERLVAHYEDWRGTPYAYGGSSRGGVDCSGFVQLTYARLYDLALPRTARALRSAGTEVSAATLTPGDLVFFDERRKDGHVGIYLGDGWFAHASSRRGVVADRIDSNYWAPRFSAAVRISGGA
jgi:lipoprotein Spr